MAFTKRTGYILGGVIAALAVIAVAIWLIIRATVGSISVPGDAPQQSTNNPAESVTGFKLPDGWSMGIFAKNLPDVRVMIFDAKARMLVSQPSEGRVSALSDTDGDGAAEETRVVADGLQEPHGLALDCQSDCKLYVAESNQLSRFDYDSETGTVSNKTKLLDFDVSTSDRHKTRTLLFMPSPNENTLLISVGSTCNVCTESGTQHGKILAFDTKTGASREYARGLRNAVFMTTNHITGKVYVTEMGRDGLGDDIPPDEINVIEEGKNYGWPTCYGKNVHDGNFDKKTYIRNPCMEPFETPSLVDIPAHSAPLGLAFIPEEGWPEDMWNNLLVAYHGSWNRSTPTGYKIVRMVFDQKGAYKRTEDFITGWLRPDGKKLGRPADVMALPGGTVYISDDTAGIIYKASLNQSPNQ